VADNPRSAEPHSTVRQAPGSISERARSDSHRLSAAWVSLGSGVFAFGTALCAWSAIDFEFSNPHEIASRITLARYPKQQDLAGYLLAIFAVASGVLVGWHAWCGLASRWARANSARGGSRDSRDSRDSTEPTDRTGPDALLDSSLTRWVLPFASLLVALVPLATARWSFLELVALPLLVAGLAGCWANWGRGSTMTTASSEPSPRRDSPDPAGEASRLRAKPLRSLFLVVVVPLLLYAWLYDGYLIHHRIDLHHEGEILAPWAALLEGAVPFRDIYIQHGLFQNVGKGWLAERLFGVSVASLRATEHLLAPLGHLALYLVGLALFRSWLSAVALVLVVSVSNLWAVDRQALGLLAVAALAYAATSGRLAGTPEPESWRTSLRNNALPLSSGVATTLAFFYSAEVGLFSAAACSGFLFLRMCFDREVRGSQRWLPLASYLAAALLCFVPFAAALTSVDALDDMVRNTWRQIVYQPTVWGRPFPPLEATLEGVDGPTSAGAALVGKWFQWYWPPFVYLFAVGHVTLQTLRGHLWQRPRSGALLLVVLASLCYFGSALSRADSFHLKFGTLLMWLLVGLALEGVVSRGRRAFLRAPDSRSRLRAAAWPALACAALVIHLSAVHDPVGKWTRRAEDITAGRYWPQSVRTPWERLGGIRIGDSEFAQLREVVSYVREQTDRNESIFDFSSQSAYYFLAQRRNPTRYALAAYAATPEMQREVNADLERNATRLVIYRSGGYLDRLDRVPFAKRSAVIKSYLQEHYDKATQIGGTVILLRKQDPNPENPNSP
jgi:hypothetical protein